MACNGPGPATSSPTGRFSWPNATPQAQVTLLKRNPFYYAADQVQLDEVRWLVAEDTAASLKRYRAGEIDISSVPPTELDCGPQHLSGRAARRAAAIAGRVSSSSICGTEPFADNPKLREALALVIDRDTS
jgi:oligopeptide transport system substrate-binding protein